MSYIVINKNTCKGCELCVSACPHHLVCMSEDINNKGVHYAVYNEVNKCTACTLCATMCPDNCIEVYREKNK